MTEQEHFIHVKSLQEFHGGFNESMIGTDGQMSLEVHDEISVYFTCECGEKFHRKHKAEEHLLEQ